MSATVPHTPRHHRWPAPAPAGLRRLTPGDRRRILARIQGLDRLAALVRERPFAGRWTA